MRWFRERYARLSLRQKFALQLAFLVALLFAVLLPSVLIVQERALFAQIEKDGTHLVRLFAFSSVQGIVADDFLLLQGAVRSIASRPDIRYAMLLNLDGHVRVHSDPREVGRVLEDAASLEALRADTPPVREVRLEDGTRAMEFASPVLVLNARRAVARLAISLEDPLRGIRRTRNSILVLGGLALLAGVGLAFFQGRRIALPMQALAGAARELARGKLARRIPVASGDELGEVAAAFNKMAESLQALFETSRQVSSSLRLADVLQTIVQHAQRAVGSDTAAIAPYDAQGKVATVVASAGSPTPALMNLRVLSGQGLGGKVLETGKAFVTTDYLTDPRFSHRYDERVRREGIKAAAAVPLLHQGEILGILWVANRRSDSFTEEHVETLSTLASHAAIALKNARLHDAAVRRSEELAALLRATQSVMAGLDLQGTLERIVEEASRIARVQRVAAFLVDHRAGSLQPGAVAGGSLYPAQIPLGASFSGIVAKTGQPLFVPDTRNDPRKFLTDRQRGFGFVSYLGLPVKVRGEVVGVLAFYTESSRQYGEDEVAYLASFADQAAVAIANARLHGAAVRRGEELAALLRATQTVMAGLDLKVILERIVTEASRIAGVPHVTAFLADRGAGILRPGAATGGSIPAGFQIRLGTSFSGTVATTGQPLFVADTRDDPRKILTDRDRGFDFRTYLGLPITVRGEVVGVLAFYTESPREYGEAELAYLASFADQAAIAIENARLYETLRRSHEELVAAQAEQVRSARLAAVGELAAGIAHETRNPLGAISHATETLQRSLDLRGEDAELLEIIRREAARLNEIVSDFLVFGRPRPVALQETDLGVLIKDVLLALEQDERCHRAMRFETVLDPALPRLPLDPHHMSQVLWNLYLNAAQAMPQGGVLQTRAALLAGPDGSAWVALEISDTGPGISSEAKGRLFEPFFTTKLDGTGLGLPIARRIVEEHGGTLTVEPGPAGGTLARIRLPLREVGTDAADPGR